VHGAWMSEELARHGHRISPGTLCPALHRMEAAGLLVSEERVVEGRMLRLYRATAKGKDELATTRRILPEVIRIWNQARHHSLCSTAQSQRERLRADR